MVTSGRNPQAYHGTSIHPFITRRPCFIPRRGSGCPRGRYQYGRRGTPTSEALETALTELEGEGCAVSRCCRRELAAIAATLLATVGSGDHILVADSVTGRPQLLRGRAQAHGRANDYYDADRRNIASLFKPNTRVVFVEAPGSQSFEMQDYHRSRGSHMTTAHLC